MAKKQASFILASLPLINIIILSQILSFVDYISRFSLQLQCSVFINPHLPVFAFYDDGCHGTSIHEMPPLCTFFEDYALF